MRVSFLDFGILFAPRPCNKVDYVLASFGATMDPGASMVWPDSILKVVIVPICLLNVSDKILTKVLPFRLSRLIDKLVLSTQTAFLKGRYIMEGVLTLHETLHELHRKKKSRILFKVDFKKAYDKVK